MYRMNNTLKYGSMLAAAGLVLALTPSGSALAAPPPGVAQPSMIRAGAPAPVQVNPSLNLAVMETLRQCQQLSPSCASTTRNAVGVLVFPSVLKADLIIGGSGGKGALIENGRITEYYSIGSVSAGLQAGIESSSQIYAFRTTESLIELKRSPDFKLGAKAGVTLVSADANGAATTDQNVYAYVFDGKGLHAGVSLDALDVWKTGQTRP